MPVPAEVPPLTPPVTAVDAVVQRPSRCLRRRHLISSCDLPPSARSASLPVPAGRRRRLRGVNAPGVHPATPSPGCWLVPLATRERLVCGAGRAG